MKNVRAWFFKQNNLKYISHLDLNRCMLKAVKRANLPIWYTQGFNPHPFITFALPLSLGIAGKNEVMDFKLTQNIDNDEIKNTLNAVLPYDIKITNVSEPIMKPNKIAFALYYIKIFCDNLSANKLYTHFKTWINKDILPASKKTKRGIKDVNLKDFIKDYELTANDKSVNLKIILCAGNENNINPHLILNTFKNNLNINIYSNITREKLLDENMNDFK